MKKITLTIFVLAITFSSFACPFCGCGVGNFYIGLLPDFQKRFIGLRYQYLPYETNIKGGEGEFSKDYYHTIEVWGGINLGKRWQLLGFVPYQINYQNTDDGIKTLSGISDVSALANYKLLDKTKMGEGRATSQQLWIGAGIKLPTGKYQIDPNNPETEIGDVNSQAGTGSVDFMLNTSYNVRFNKIGLNTSATYKINTENKENYQFGNRFNVSSFVFYAAKMRNTTLSPNVGIIYQHSATNNFNNEKVDLTGGQLTTAAAGIEVGIKKITIGGNIQIPVSQDYAEGQTEARTRAMVHMSFSF
jgi:hypothetical protein